MRYFTINELCKSTTAERLGIKNRPTDAHEENLRYLVDTLLDPIRELWGAPLYVTSGYRCDMLNTAVGGAHTSAHLYGLAADIITGKGKAANSELWRLIKNSGLPYDQIIDEKGGSWLHIGASRHPRRQALTFDGKLYKLWA